MDGDTKYKSEDEYQLLPGECILLNRPDIDTDLTCLNFVKCLLHYVNYRISATTYRYNNSKSTSNKLKYLLKY